MLPRRTRRLTPRTAIKPANSLVRSSVSRIGGQPWDITISPDGTHAYVAYYNDSTIKVLALNG